MSDIHYGTRYGNWSHIKTVMTKIKKHRKHGVWCEVVELENTRHLSELDAHYFLAPGILYSLERVFRVDVWGPGKSKEDIGKFLVVQMDDSGVAVSRIMSTLQMAQQSTRSARGVKSYVCKIVDCVDSTGAKS